ncbi:hypothetical protein ACPV5Q_19435 [Vibrio astriarenae]
MNRISRTNFSKLAFVSSVGLLTYLHVPNASAVFKEQTMNQACMAEQAGFALNCTANDIQVSQVTNITDLEGNPQVECVLGQPVTFKADVTVITTAQNRYDYSIYLPEGEWSAQEFNTNNTCSILLGEADDNPGVDLEDNLDSCADITKRGGAGTHVYTGETITLTCLDADSSGRADFNYCAAWHNKAQADCSIDNPAAPGTPSKCRCDTFDIDVFIAPEPPKITKTVTPTSASEPSGTFTYSVKIERQANEVSSLFIHKIEDIITSDSVISDDTPSLHEYTFDVTNVTDYGVKQGNLTLLNPGGLDSCLNLGISPTTPFELSPTTTTFECKFQIKIDDENLPSSSTPEAYQDFVRLTLRDKNGNDVGNNSCSAPSTAAVSNPNCSTQAEVKVENVNPTITVTKEANPISVPETLDGTNVTYDVTVKNNSSFESLEIISLLDTVGNNTAVNLAGDDDCKVGSVVAPNGQCMFSYTQSVNGIPSATISNSVEVKAKDNEQVIVNDDDTAIVTITNSPGMIKLTKTANPTSVTESGADVEFTFEIKNTSPVDSITLKDLQDTDFGTLFDSNGFLGSCNFYDQVLAPNGMMSCTYTTLLSGEPNVDHENIATVTGITEDTLFCTDFTGETPCPCSNGISCLEEVSASDNATVAFINEPVNVALSVDLAVTLDISITNNSSYDSVNLDSLTIAGFEISTDVDGPTTGGKFEITFSDCDTNLDAQPEVIAPLSSYDCSFTANLLDASSTNTFSIATGADLKIVVSDNDSTPANNVAVNVKAQLEN